MTSLTQDEARTRAALLDVERYDVAVDLTGLLRGDELRSVSTIHFTCRTPGASTFVECAMQVESAVLNGAAIPSAQGPRIELAGLATDNVLIVTASQRDTGSRTGAHRSVDPSDGRVYVWTSFEPDEAHRVWACFDQPDLKAPWAFDVTAPPDWTVLTSTGSVEVSDVAGGRRWRFADTARLSSYVPALNAGPFHELRRSVDGVDLGLYCRRSLAGSLDRDGDELFDVTAAGLAFFGEKFAMAFPEPRYDQVFVPDLGGAMENYGCVVWSDYFVYRTPPSDGERELRTEVLLHEMAHMWFGDIVTMRWWDDLWLNEAFAQWACHWATTGATEHAESWASFLASSKLAGYAADRAPSRHPIRQDAPDVATASAGFDNITYEKGAAVLKQLVAYVGEDRFLTALRAYFGKHAWGNATLDDLMSEISAASGRDMAAWTAAWLESAGTDTLSLQGSTLTATGADGGEPRPHRLSIGRYRQDGSFDRAVDVEVTGRTTEVPGVADAELLLVNDGDLTFAEVQLDDASVTALLASAHLLPTTLARTLALTTAWQLLVTGRLRAEQLVACGVRVLPVETTAAVVEPLLSRIVAAADLWSPDISRHALLEQVADACVQMARSPELRVAAVRTLAESATTDSQLAALTELADDVDLCWRRLMRLAALGRVDLAEAERLQGEDPDPDAWVRALAVRTAQPDAAAKTEAWEAVMSGTKVPLGGGWVIGRAFWQRSQADVLTSFGPRYVEGLAQMGAGGMIPAMFASAVLFPRVGVDAAFLDELDRAAQAPEVHPIVAHTVMERGDELRRMLAARG
ncbi:MAG: aminopeptidase N [Mycobacteriales bacterium]